jgi:hypothetical protein
MQTFLSLQTTHELDGKVTESIMSNAFDIERVRFDFV